MTKISLLKVRQSLRFENGNARGFFFFGGIDGEADTLWQGFSSFTDIPCLKCILDARGNKSMNGLASMRAAGECPVAEISFETFREDTVVPLSSARRLAKGSRFSGFFFGIRPAMRSGRETRRKASERIPRAIGNDEITETEERFVFLPHGNVEKGVGANHEKKCGSPWP